MVAAVRVAASYSAAGTLAQVLDPGVDVPLPGGGTAELAGRSGDPLASVALALLAYALVQLLSRLVDRLPMRRGHGESGGGSAAGHAQAPPFGADDRKRLERVHEIVAADHARIERLEGTVREVHEQTRWLHEQRLLAREPGGPFHCRAAALEEEIATNRRLIGQALDALRDVQAQVANVLRKLRALWVRVGRRQGDD
jgi:hypothetical protein